MTLFTLSTSLSLSNRAVISASTCTFFDGLPPIATAPVIFFNELREVSTPPAEFVRLCTRLLREVLLTCGGVWGFEFEDAFSGLILGSYLFEGEHKAG